MRNSMVTHELIPQNDFEALSKRAARHHTQLLSLIASEVECNSILDLLELILYEGMSPNAKVAHSVALMDNTLLVVFYLIDNFDFSLVYISDRLRPVHALHHTSLANPIPLHSLIFRPLMLSEEYKSSLLMPDPIRVLLNSAYVLIRSISEKQNIEWYNLLDTADDWLTERDS